MIKFERYPHVNDLIVFYMEENRRSDIAKIMVYGISEEVEAKTFCQFIWSTIDQIHKDAETGRVVLGRPDNTVILPDLSYEVTSYMRKKGFISVWKESAGVCT